jgi:hypothetical protein
LLGRRFHAPGSKRTSRFIFAHDLSENRCTLFRIMR